MENDHHDDVKSALRPGDRVRIEQHVFASDDFVEAAYLPQEVAEELKPVTMLAVDAATDYVVGIGVSFSPSVNDAVELLANIMRVKTEQKGFRLDWYGCKPSVLEVGEGSVFCAPELREKLGQFGIAIEVVANAEACVTKALATHVCVSPEMVRRLRKAEGKSTAKRKKKGAPIAFDEYRRPEAQAYLRAALHHGFRFAALSKWQSRNDGGSRLRDFERVCRKVILPTEHELRVALCNAAKGPMIEADGITWHGIRYDAPELEELGYEIEETPTTIKVGKWNLDTLSVRGLDGSWFEVSIENEDVPPGVSHLELDFGAAIAESARQVGLRDLDAVFCDAIRLLRQGRIPAFDPYSALVRRHKKNTGVGMVRLPIRAELPGFIVKIEEFQVDLLSSRPGYLEPGAKELATVYLAVDVATGYVVSLKTIDEPSESAALDLISTMMRPKSCWASEAGASHRWPGELNPHRVVVEPGSLFDGERLERAFEKLNIRKMHVDVPVAIDLLSLLEDEWLIPSPEDEPKTFNLERLLLRVICDKYHRTPQLMLGGKTPQEAFDEHPVAGKVLPDATMVREAVGHDLSAVIGPHGIEVEGEFYNSEGLQRVGKRLKGKPAEFRYDPMAMGAISVRAKDDLLSSLMDEGWEQVPSVRDISLTTSVDDLRAMRFQMEDKPMVSSRQMYEATKAHRRATN